MLETLAQPWSRFLNLAIGVGLALLAAFLSSLGINLQAHSLERQRKLNEEYERDLGMFEALHEVKEDFAGSAGGVASPVSLNPELTSTAGGVKEDEEYPETVSESDFLNPSSSALRKSANASPQVTTLKFYDRYILPYQWYLGFTLYLTCEMTGSIAALSFISPIIFAPLGSSGLLFNLFFSGVLLGRKPTTSNWIGTLLVVFGCGFVTSFASVIDFPTFTSEELLSALFRPPFFIFIISQTLAILMLLGTVWFLSSYHHPKDGKRPTSSFLRVQSYRSLALSSPVHTQNSSPRSSKMISARVIFESPTSSIVTAEKESMRIRQHSLTWWIGVLYAITGGMCASQTLLWTKSSLDVILSTLKRPSQSDPKLLTLSLGLALLLACSVGSQLYCLNRGMHYQLPVLIIPIFYTLFTCLSFASTLVIQATYPFTLLQSMGILAGMMAILLGVWMLSSVAEPLAGEGRVVVQDAGVDDAEVVVRASGDERELLLSHLSSNSSINRAHRLLQDAESLM